MTSEGEVKLSSTRFKWIPGLHFTEAIAYKDPGRNVCLAEFFMGTLAIQHGWSCFVSRECSCTNGICPTGFYNTQTSWGLERCFKKTLVNRTWEVPQRVRKPCSHGAYLKPNILCGIFEWVLQANRLSTWSMLKAQYWQRCLLAPQILRIKQLWIQEIQSIWRNQCTEYLERLNVSAFSQQLWRQSFLIALTWPIIKSSSNTFRDHIRHWNRGMKDFCPGTSVGVKCNDHHSLAEIIPTSQALKTAPH